MGDTLDAIVADYLARTAGCDPCCGEDLDGFAEVPDIGTAIHRAAPCLTSLDRRHPHQRRARRFLFRPVGNRHGRRLGEIFFVSGAEPRWASWPSSQPTATYISAMPSRGPTRPGEGSASRTCGLGPADLVAAAYRAQGDALLIESQAKMRLADEYDAAQERGDVQTPGGDRTSIVPRQNNAPATVEDLGLSRKDIHEARQIRDAEKANPGIVKRAVDESVSARQEPTKAAVHGAKARISGSPRLNPRPRNDFALLRPSADVTSSR